MPPWIVLFLDWYIYDCNEFVDFFPVSLNFTSYEIEIEKQIVKNQVFGG